MIGIGICGKPNCGKSTFFSAVTMVDVPIADYPFTTIKANRGIAYVRAKCPCRERGVTCQPKNSKCIDGVRLVPTTVIDVAGLVPGAHEGRGLGNKFLDDLRNASAIIQVVDASGRTDLEGKPAGDFDPLLEVGMLETEMAQWMAAVMRREVGTGRTSTADTVADRMSGLGITREHVVKACDSCGQTHDKIGFSGDGAMMTFARELRRISKPILVVANKMDVRGAEENFERMREALGRERVMPSYAEGELALRRADRAGMIKYVPGEAGFEVIGGDERQREALGLIGKVMNKYGGTGVQDAVDRAAFGLLELNIVYPVENEARLSDGSGNVLPDAILLKKGSSALDLAREIHSELADKFICAIDVKRRMKVGRDHVLRDGDIIKIVKGR